MQSHAMGDKQHHVYNVYVPNGIYKDDKEF